MEPAKNKIDDFEAASFVRAEQAISTEQSNETVILDLATGVYSGLNEVGNDIWNLLEKPCSVAEICGALLEEYDVNEEQCKESVLQFLQILIDEGLVVTK